MFVDLLVRYGGVACGKVLMATQGIDAGDPHLPLAALTAEQKQSILREYGEIMVSAQRAPSGFEIASVLCFFQPRTI